MKIFSNVAAPINRVVKQKTHKTVAFSSISKSLRLNFGFIGRLCELTREIEGVIEGLLFRTATSIEDSEAAESLRNRVFGDWQLVILLASLSSIVSAFDFPANLFGYNTHKVYRETNKTNQKHC
jgi:hypothetical protein